MSDRTFANVVSWMFYATLSISTALFFADLIFDVPDNIQIYGLILFTLTPLIALIASLPSSNIRVKLLKLAVIFELVVAFLSSFF